MRSVEFGSGLIAEWDDTLSVGQLVTAYKKGYHIVTAIEHRDGHPPLIKYVQVVTPAGKRCKSQTQQVCDASYVRSLSKEKIVDIFRDEVAAATSKRDNLLNFVAK